MDPVGIASAFVSSQAGSTQLELARSFERMNADASAAVVKLIDAATQNANSLANVAAGVGGNVDISA